MQCSTMQSSTMQSYTMQCSTIQCSTVQSSTMQSTSTLQSGTLQCSTMNSQHKSLQLAGYKSHYHLHHTSPHLCSLQLLFHCFQQSLIFILSLCSYCHRNCVLRTYVRSTVRSTIYALHFSAFLRCIFLSFFV